MLPAEKFHSPTEIATALGVSLTLVRREIARGHIRGVKIGRRVVIPASELTRLRSGGGQ